MTNFVALFLKFLEYLHLLAQVDNLTMYMAKPQITQEHVHIHLAVKNILKKILDQNARKTENKKIGKNALLAN